MNPQLPHYKQVRAFHVHAEPFSIENGLLTANGKLKRDLIAARLQPEIEEMYGVKQASYRHKVAPASRRLSRGRLALGSWR